MNPGPIFDCFSAYQKTAAMQAAVDIGMFSAIAAGSNTVAAIAKSCAASAKGVRVPVRLLDRKRHAYEVRRAIRAHAGSRTLSRSCLARIPGRRAWLSQRPDQTVLRTTRRKPSATAAARRPVRSSRNTKGGFRSRSRWAR